MILALPADVRERLADIEAREGIPAVDFCHQAISVWSQLQTEEQRKAAMFNILRDRIAHIMEGRETGDAKH